jgi:hypothetical protein
LAGAIKIMGGSDIRIIDCGFSNFENGVDAEDCSGLHINGNHFNNVKNPVKARKINGLVAKRNIDHSTFTKTRNGLQMTLIAVLVKEYIMILKRTLYANV